MKQNCNMIFDLFAGKGRLVLSIIGQKIVKCMHAVGASKNINTQRAAHSLSIMRNRRVDSWTLDASWLRWTLHVITFGRT